MPPQKQNPDQLKKKLAKWTKKHEEEEKRETQLYLLKRGAVERNIFTDSRHFLVLLRVIYRSEHDNSSYPAEITRDLFKVDESTDITKTSEYSHILRYLRRWEEEGILHKGGEKLKHNLSYFIVDYDAITEHLLDLLYINSGPYTKEHLATLKHKDNNYIHAFVRLYLYFASTEPNAFEELSLNETLLKMIDYFFRSIDARFKELADTIPATASKKDIGWDELIEEGVLKQGTNYIEKTQFNGLVTTDGKDDALEEELMGRAILSEKGDNEKLKQIQERKINAVPQHIYEAIRNKRIEEFIRFRDESVLLNFSRGMEKYNGNDDKLYQLFNFLFILQHYYQDEYGEFTKTKCELVMPELQSFVERKFNPPRSNDQYQTDKLEDMKKMSDFHFFY